MNEKTFYPYIEVVFDIENPAEHYHVPILLNAFGYSTYRGS
jgi:5-hydroxyisourate hydrolase-like protein (transthyretin family)